MIEVLFGQEKNSPEHPSLGGPRGMCPVCKNEYGLHWDSKTGNNWCDLCGWDDDKEKTNEEEAVEDALIERIITYLKEHNKSNLVFGDVTRAIMLLYTKADFLLDKDLRYDHFRNKLIYALLERRD
jgi:hypothetical protein